MIPAVCPHIPPTAPADIERVRQWELAILEHPQAEIETTHTLHAGLYARTIRIPADTALTGALIKLATVLIVSGDVIIFMGEESQRLTGYHVLTASAGRKQAFITCAETYLTMVFATSATTVEDAEAEFTDEASRLLSRRQKEN